MSDPPRIRLSGLNKRFGDTQVLHDVTLTVMRGELHGLAGQNGSGKSTLIKILTGVYSPDAGAELEVDGGAMSLPVRWKEVHKAGVSVVHQDLGILDELTVAENVCVGGFPRGRLGNVDRRQRDALCAQALRRVGATIEASTIAGHLSAAERALVAIARALRDHKFGEGLIILDESTRSLSGDELRGIHDVLRRLVAEGSSVLMISHNLKELAAIADRVSVLRDGRLVADGLSMREAGPADIARHMLGKQWDSRTPAGVPSRVQRSASPPAAVVSGLRTGHLNEITFRIEPGEVLGIIGLPGSGYEDIPYALTGAKTALAGTLDVAEARIDLTRCRPADCIRAGVVLIPERRDRDGLALEMGVRDNICLPALRRRSHRWFLGRAWQQEAFIRVTQSLELKCAGPMSLVRELSGGNQQKALLAKWLGVNPSVLVLHEPTQAVDVGARQDIINALRSIAARGVGILLVSSEAEDLTNLCNRIYICHHERGLIESTAGSADSLIDEVYRSNEEHTGANIAAK